ncbi:hypothetical protein [Arachidicoccus terrestris]|uniref:hypothetical protein n=1 Tax=Arachidicoccus terrestris TaxID=2875539 RepID=UPI001CC35264|nr:hypothetical protein [Arachidicoccus terrestris]UAY55334.1 hypothetical protein K9M52_18320 [Arachidicoccus terrestris]
MSHHSCMPKQWSYFRNAQLFLHARHINLSDSRFPIVENLLKYVTPFPNQGENLESSGLEDAGKAVMGLLNLLIDRINKIY